MATNDKVERYNGLIEKAYQRIDHIKKLPYYRIFNRELERKSDIKKKLELIEWLTKRKATAYIPQC